MCFVDGVRAGERRESVAIGNLPRLLNDPVKQGWVTKLARCSRELYQNRAAISFGDDLCGVVQTSHGSADVVGLS